MSVTIATNFAIRSNAPSFSFRSWHFHLTKRGLAAPSGISFRIDAKAAVSQGARDLRCDGGLCLQSMENGSTVAADQRHPLVARYPRRFVDL
jgi:hypothetical protein